MRVLCNNEKCVHWKACAPQHIVYGRSQESLTEYQGECARKQEDAAGEEVIGILTKTIIQGHGTSEVRMVVPECQCFSVMGVSGHMNFSRMLNSDGTPMGGNIPDPIPGDTVFHS